MNNAVRDYTEFALEKAVELIGIDSPAGYTFEAAKWLVDQFVQLGYEPKMTVKGGVTVDLGGEGEGTMLMGHIDTLGGMVREIKPNGRLRLVKIGGPSTFNYSTENVTVVTKFSGTYEGTFQLVNPSIHVSKDVDGKVHDFDDCEVLLDENVNCAEDVEMLGISPGDFVCFCPRTVVTANGYIKSRFLDDKLSCAILLAYAKFLKETGTVPARHIYLNFTVFEEVGYGGAGFLPEDCTEAISVDMGCVGEGLSCTDRMLSICAKDSVGPYHYDVVKGLETAAINANADYAVDVYPMYGSDSDALIRYADVRHGCIGPGVYASHGYERSHKDAITATLLVLDSYLD